MERLSEPSIYFTRDYMTKSAKDHNNIEDTKGDLQNQYVRTKGCFDSTLVSHMLNPNLFLFKLSHF